MNTTPARIAFTLLTLLAAALAVPVCQHHAHAHGHHALEDAGQMLDALWIELLDVAETVHKAHLDEERAAHLAAHLAAH